MSNVAIVNERKGRIHPQRFALYVAMASIFMMFAALTSAYIVKKGQESFLEFGLPRAFFISTGFIIGSSIVLHAAYIAYKEGKAKLFRLLTVIAFFLGLSFVISQYQGWVQLNEIGVYLQVDAAASFLYLLTGLHVLHVLGGIGALTVALVLAYKRKFRVTEKRKLKFQLVLHYWHFVDVLWVYLLVFLLMQQ